MPPLDSFENNRYNFEIKAMFHFKFKIERKPFDGVWEAIFRTQRAPNMCRQS